MHAFPKKRQGSKFKDSNLDPCNAGAHSPPSEFTQRVLIRQNPSQDFQSDDLKGQVLAELEIFFWRRFFETGSN